MHNMQSSAGFRYTLLSLFWMLIDTMFARDMYQVYEINDDWYIFF